MRISDDRSAAPATCHHTETLFMIAIRWLLKMFSTDASAEHDHEDDEHPGQRVVGGVGVREGADRQVDERGAAVGHTGGDRDQADQVQPAGEEAGRRPAELGRPPVDAARGRVRRHQLRHREADDQDEDAEDRPRPRDRDRAAVVEAGPEVGEAAGEDRDDRERDGEVGEARPRAVQVLAVSEFRQVLLVVGEFPWRGGTSTGSCASGMWHLLGVRSNDCLEARPARIRL